MGPLKGYTVIELAGLGPCPMAGMLLADMGARVVRVERGKGGMPAQTGDVSLRGKESIALNLKDPRGVETLLKLVEGADALIEGFRPGVAERLGIGPEPCRARNRKLVYGRMTGWGQDGPLANAAGHDLNYIAITGALHAIGPADGKPVVPLNLIGDMGGGGMLLALGVVAALLEAQKSGEGQVIDAAMVDGTAQLMWMQHFMAASGVWNTKARASNMLDGGAPYYDTYETADGKYVAIGAIEPQFYAELLKRTGLDATLAAAQHNPKQWPQTRGTLVDLFRSKTRDEWCEVLEGTDACFAPVLSLDEVAAYRHNRERGTYIEIGGVTQPAPAPRFSRTPSEVAHAPHPPGADGESVLHSFGFDEAAVKDLVAAKVLL